VQNVGNFQKILQTYLQNKTNSGSLYVHSGLYVANSSIHGKGVFTSESIPRAHLIERCHIIGQIPYHDHDTLYGLEKYWFEWDSCTVVLPLGFGGIYNHSENPNIYWDKDLLNKLITFIAIKNIEAHDELFFNYGRIDI